ncbi:hypothetical protein B0J12DRAFT_151580 [Macrophomina phaseolina]|uniref:Uncharacterized protein n=1 Tax=Macrophomina phaseolina TaxID=35725 RepID=A0ABQ8G504_9PEZI|nr:hypothetical protein B0J12DRAFT_151580 [Macrophomina phaseolina]
MVLVGFSQSRPAPSSSFAHNSAPAARPPPSRPAARPRGPAISSHISARTLGSTALTRPLHTTYYCMRTKVRRRDSRWQQCRVRLSKPNVQLIRWTFHPYPHPTTHGPRTLEKVHLAAGGRPADARASPNACWTSAAALPAKRKKEIVIRRACDYRVTLSSLSLHLFPLARRSHERRRRRGRQLGVMQSAVARALSGYPATCGIAILSLS